MGGTRILSHADLCARLNDRISAFDQALAANPAAPQSELLAAVDQEYWRAVAATVEGCVPLDLPKEIKLRPEDALLLSFGIPAGARFEARAAAARAALDKQVKGEFQVRHLHDAVLSCYRDALRLETLARLRAKLEAVDKELDDWPEAHLQYVKYRDRMVSDALGGTPQEEQVLRLYSELDERLEQFKEMERRNQSEGWRTSDERRDWLSMRGYIDQRVKGVAAALEPLTRQLRTAKDEIAALEAAASPEAAAARGRHARVLAAEGLLAAAEAVSESVNHLLDLRNERRLVEAQILDEENTVHQVTIGEVRGNLLNEVGNVRSMLRLAAKYARVQECAVPLRQDGVEIKPEDALAALREIEEFDPRLFANPGIKRFGKPEVFLASGLGDGVFDTDRNRLVIPQRTLKTALDSVAHAVVLYRLDMDAAYDDRRLFKAWREDIKENSGVRSNLKLRQSLLRDYLIWVTREARGETALARETREWFERHVAPQKHHPMTPREFLGLSQRQLQQKLEETDRGKASPERDHRVTVLLWLLDPGNDAHLREKVLPRAESALALGPDFPATVYSAATLYKLAGQLPRAAELFNHFARVAKPSWWRHKALELAAQCAG